jgi:hypothetical protein
MAAEGFVQRLAGVRVRLMLRGGQPTAAAGITGAECGRAKQWPPMLPAGATPGSAAREIMADSRMPPMS